MHRDTTHALEVRIVDGLQDAGAVLMDGVLWVGRGSSLAETAQRVAAALAAIGAPAQDFPMEFHE